MNDVFAYLLDEYLCPDCYNSVCLDLIRRGKKPADTEPPNPEVYPTGPVLSFEADHPVHCAKCRKYLGVPLTYLGVEYVVRAITAFCKARIAGSSVYGDVDILVIWAKAIEDAQLEANDAAVVALFRESVS